MTDTHTRRVPLRRVCVIHTHQIHPSRLQSINQSHVPTEDMASSLKNKFEEMAKPEEKPVVKAKKLNKVKGLLLYFHFLEKK